MRPIIAPTDFSPASLNAVNYAADLACALNSNLYLIHILQLPPIYGEVPVALENLDDSVNAAEQRIKQVKEDIIQRTGNKIRVHTEVRAGTIIPELKNLCDLLDAGFVIMGARGAGALERALLGSNTVSAMKNLAWPLIVVPADAKFTTIKKIGLACDLKKVLESAPIEELVDLVKYFRSELHVIHINTQREDIHSMERTEELELLEEMLKELHPVYHFLNSGNIDDCLAEFAEKNQLDLLVLIPRRHNLIEGLFHRSHTKQLILHTHVPVMSVHE